MKKLVLPGVRKEYASNYNEKIAIGWINIWELPYRKIVNKKEC
jgi:hypothetical protein